MKDWFACFLDVSQGKCLGHMKVDDKSNEIRTVPKFMELLDSKGTIITADAMGRNKMSRIAGGMMIRMINPLVFQPSL